MRLSILPLGLLSFHDMILAVIISATVFLAIGICVVLNRLEHRRRLTQRLERMLW